MTQQDVSPTTQNYLIYKGSFSSVVSYVLLHFCNDGPEKLGQLLQSTSRGFAHHWLTSFRLNPPFGVWDSEALIRLTDLLLGIEYFPNRVMEEARLRFLLAWTSLYDMPFPLISTVLKSDGILHLIVECPSGATKLFKELSADFLQFFNSVESGPPAQPKVAAFLKRFRPAGTEVTTPLKRRQLFG
jgi:hypothetical protein